MKDFPCRRCDKPAAKHNGVDLFIEGDKVPGNPKEVVFPCPHCARWVKWRRDEGPTNRKRLIKMPI